MRRLIIWGAGGHGKVVLDVARRMGLYREIGFIDDNPAMDGQIFCGCPISGLPADPVRYEGSEVVIAIGANRVRSLNYLKAAGWNVRLATLVHTAAVIDDSAVVGCGTVVMAGAIVNGFARIGVNCIVNTGAIVEHDCKIGDHCHLSPRSVLGGEVRIGNYAHIGMGAVVLPGVVIGEGAIVGAGAVVIQSVGAGETVVGVPARALQHQEDKSTISARLDAPTKGVRCE